MTSQVANVSYSIVAKTTTDGTGSYSAFFDYHNANKYKIFASKDNYFPSEYIISASKIERDETNNFDLKALPIGHVRLNVKRTNTDTSTNKYMLILKLAESDFNCRHCFNPDSLAFIGKHLDTTIFGQTIGNQKLYYHYRKYKNLVLDELTIDSTFIVLGDTTEIKISY